MLLTAPEICDFYFRYYKNIHGISYMNFQPFYIAFVLCVRSSVGEKGKRREAKGKT